MGRLDQTGARHDTRSLTSLLLGARPCDAIPRHSVASYGGPTAYPTPLAPTGLHRFQLALRNDGLERRTRLLGQCVTGGGRNSAATTIVSPLSGQLPYCSPIHNQRPHRYAWPTTVFPLLLATYSFSVPRPTDIAYTAQQFTQTDRLRLWHTGTRRPGSPNLGRRCPVLVLAGNGFRVRVVGDDTDDRLIRSASMTSLTASRCMSGVGMGEPPGNAYY